MSNETGHVVIAGGGVAALEAARTLRAVADGRLSVELSLPSPTSGTGRLRSPSRSSSARCAASSSRTLAARGRCDLHARRRSSRVDVGPPHRVHVDRATVPYDVLLVACGADADAGRPGALTFRGPADTEQDRAPARRDRDAARCGASPFVVPAGAVWSLPAYELALMTRCLARRARHRGRGAGARHARGASRCSSSGERRATPCSELLDERGIAAAHAARSPAEWRTDELLLAGAGSSPADRVVALPRLQGPSHRRHPADLRGLHPGRRRTDG